MADTTETVVLEFVPQDGGLKDYLDGIEKELQDITKANPKIGQQLAQGISDATKEMSKQAIAAGEDKKKVDALAAALNNLSKGIAGQAAKQLTTEFQKFGTQVTEVTKKLPSLQSELRKIRNELAGMDEGTARFQELSIEAAKLEDKIGDVNQRIRVMASDTFAIDALVDGVRGVTAAFTFAQSAAALFGEENEDLQKALLKVQAATGLLVSVQEIANQVTGQGAAKIAVLTFAQSAYAKVVGQSTGALKAFRIALALSGIGLVVAAVATLAANWDKVKKAVGLAGDESKNFHQAELNRIDFLIRRNQILGESTDELRRRRIEEQLAIANEEGDMEKQNELLRERKLLELEISKEIVRRGFQNDIDRIQRSIELAKEGSKEELELKKDLVDAERRLITGTNKFIQDDLIQILKVAEAKKQKLELEFQKETLRKKREAAGEAIEFDPNAQTFEDSLRELTKQIEKEFEEHPPKVGVELVVEQTKFDKLRDKLLQEDIDEIQRKRDKERQIKEFAIQSAQETFDAIFEIASQQRQREEEAQLESIDRQREKELESIQLRVDRGVITEEEGRNRQLVIEEKFRQKEAQIRLKTFRAEQQAALSQAAINAALAITQIFATVPPVIPGTLVPNPQLPIALGAAALATGLQIALIEARKPPAFAKGTKGAPGGMALVGEEGAELMYVPQGAKIIPHSETAKVLGGHPDANDILNRFNIPITSARISELRNDIGVIDYNRFESIFSKHSQKASVHLDKNGFVTIVDENHNERQYVNKRFSFK